MKPVCIEARARYCQTSAITGLFESPGRGGGRGLVFDGVGHPIGRAVLARWPSPGSGPRGRSFLRCAPVRCLVRSWGGESAGPGRSVVPPLCSFVGARPCLAEARLGARLRAVSKGRGTKAASPGLPGEVWHRRPPTAGRTPGGRCGGRAMGRRFFFPRGFSATPIPGVRAASTYTAADLPDLPDDGHWT